MVRLAQLGRNSVSGICKLKPKKTKNQFLARVQIRGPRSLFTIKQRNNTYDVTHFT